MRIYRWPLDGPEPPLSVRRIAIGPWPAYPKPRSPLVFLGPYGDVWIRQPCRKSVAIPKGFKGKAWQRYTCEQAGHYHWFNGDKSRPWSMLPNRARWPLAVDLDVLRYKRKRTDRQRGRSRWRR